MNSRRFWWGLLPVWMVFVFLAGFFVHASARGELQEPPPVAFTYQGRLQEGGQLTEGKYDLRFRLYDSAESGTLIAEDFHEDVDISQGRFSVMLEFPSNALSNEPGYLEIAVRPAESVNENDFTVLSPRQALTRVPYAWRADHAVKAESATSADQAQSVPWTGIRDVPNDLQDGDDNTTYTAGNGLTLTGTTFELKVGDLDARYWGLEGNALESSSVRLGSTDSQPWSVIVNNVSAITLHSDSENKAVVQFNQDAGESKTIQFGEHYRDNGIVAWGQIWDSDVGEIQLISGFGVRDVSLVDNHYRVVLRVNASQNSVFTVTVTPILDRNNTTMGLTANVTQVTINHEGYPEFDIYLFNGVNLTTGFCGFNFIVTGR